MPGIARLRYTTSHPRDMDDSLIAAHRDLPALMPHLHLPVQSGSDRILAAMNRRHTRADYLDAIARAARGAARHRVLAPISSSASRARREDDFRDTLRLVDEVGYASAFSFKYSPRPGTPAADMADQVAGRREDPSACSACRPAIDRQQAAFNARCRRPHLRRAVREGRAAIAGQIVGRSPYLQPVQVDGAGDDDRRDRAGDDHRDRRQQPVRRARSAQPRRAGRSCTAAGGLMPLRPLGLGQRIAPAAAADDSAARRSCSPSTTTASPRCCSANTGRTSR